MNKKLILCSVLILFFILTHFFLGLKSIDAQSATYDEPVHLTAGYVYLETGKYDYNGLHHPAFSEMWAALPLIFMDPALPRFHPAWLSGRWSPLEQYQFADTFLYKNRIDHEKLMSSGRVMQLILSVGLGLLLFAAGVLLAGPFCGLVAVALWAFSPTFLAHGTVVSTDLAFAIFFFSFFVCLQNAKSKWGVVLVGLSLGLCMASKYFSVTIGPIFLICLIWMKYKKEKIWIFENKLLFHFVLAFSFALVVLFIVYQGSGISVWWEGLNRIISRSQAGRSSFFLGQHGTQGWIHYFPVVFLLKTPIPVILGLVLSLFLVIRKKFVLPTLYWLPPVVFFVLACLSKVQIGHRYILVIYPFLFLAIAVALSSLAPKLKHVSWALVGWMLIGTWNSQPYYLSYFNESVGGPSQGYKYLTDSNVDWGQGLKALRKNLTDKDISDGIFLSYFGVAEPHAYGIPYINIGSDLIAGHVDDRINPRINPKKFAVSVTNFQSTYYQNKKVFEWLKAFKPEKLIANSIFLYDFSDQPEVIAYLRRMGGL